MCKFYKFRATFKNIETGEDTRTMERIAGCWSDALDYFTEQRYKKLGDVIVKIEIIATAVPTMVETPI